MKRLFFFCVLVMGISLTSAPSEAADWIFAGKSSTGTAYYDRGDIEKLPDNVIRVPVKYVYSPEGEREFRDAFKNVAIADTVGYTVYVYEIACHSASFKLTKAVTHSLKGAPIKGTDLDFVKTGQAATEHITPNSVVEKVAGAACDWAQYKR